VKILLIPDKFKGSLNAKGVTAAIRKGIKTVYRDAETISVLASDGGDGFLNAVSENKTCNEIFKTTVDSLGRKIRGSYLLNTTEKKAYIELAKASGLELLKDEERSAMRTTTLGTGMQVKDAVKRGAKEIYIGLGGSATNDAGIGIAQALGYSFLDSEGVVLQPIGANLRYIDKIELPQNLAQLKSVSFFAVNDVDNPLFGSSGASRTYAKQKGADEQEIVALDSGLKHLSEVVHRQFNIDAAQIPGAGAAGGTAYGLKVFLGAEYLSGIDFVFDLSKVETLLGNQKFDYIITGEGKFDDQTLHGKLIKGVIDLGARFDVPVVVVCGKSEVAGVALEKLRLEAVLEIADKTKSLEYNMKYAPDLIETRVSEFFISRS